MSKQVNPRITGRDLAFLKPTKKRQMAFASMAFGGAAYSRFPVEVTKIAIASYKHGLLPAMLLVPARGAVSSDKKVGLRYGWDQTTPLGLLPIVGAYEPTLRKLPIPIPGFGLTSVPNAESRWPIQQFKSRGGEDATSTGTPRSTRTASKTIDGPLANKNRQADRRPSSITPPAPLRGVGGKTAGGSYYKKGRPGARPRSPPYCWRHKKRHYCKYTK